MLEDGHLPPPSNSSAVPGDEPDDGALLAQIERGQQAALVSLHRRYVNLVYSLAARVVGEGMAAEEITQDVFLKLWRQPRAFDPARGRFSSWLLAVTRHAAIDRLRQEGRRPPEAPAARDDQPDPAETRLSGDDRREIEQSQQLRLLLEALPTEQREAIQWAYFGGLSQQEIADQLHLPLGTVKTRLRLGMQKLRALWRRDA